MVVRCGAAQVLLVPAHRLMRRARQGRQRQPQQPPALHARQRRLPVQRGRDRRPVGERLALEPRRQQLPVRGAREVQRQPAVRGREPAAATPGGRLATPTVPGERGTLAEQLRAVERVQGRTRMQGAQRPYDAVGIRGERNRAHLRCLRVARERKSPAVCPALRRMELALSAHRPGNTEILEQSVRIVARNLPPRLRRHPQLSRSTASHQATTRGNSCRRESNRKWAWPVEGSTRSETSGLAE